MHRLETLPQQKQIQHLILSPQMQQALHILQLPLLELRTKIEEEVVRNPLLETEEWEDPLPDTKPIQTAKTRDLSTIIENTVAEECSLYEHLMLQASDAFPDMRERTAAAWLIGNFDQNGWLTAPVEEVAALGGYPVGWLKSLLQTIQTFDPPGMGASTQQESLLIQLRLQGKEGSLAFRIFESHYEALLHNRLPAIAKALSEKVEAISLAVQKTLPLLHLHPGTRYTSGHYPSLPPYITPDLFILLREGVLVAEANDASLPLLRFNREYMEWLHTPSLNEETKSYLEERLHAGKWLLRTIRERNQTLCRIGRALIEIESDFFLHPKGELSPLTMQEMADRLGLHESTIARAVAQKYVSSPRGMMPLRAFFTHSYLTTSGKEVSAKTVKTLLREILAEEDKRRPLSDEALSSLLQEKGIPCARRTIAKYRHELGVGNTLQRKLFS